jgi:hypothetical protein
MRVTFFLGWPGLYTAAPAVQTAGGVSDPYGLVQPIEAHV